MTKLRLQFLAFFIVLQLGIAFLLFNSYRQMAIEEKSLWDSESVKVYNQMQAKISDLLNLEDARSFRDYRFYSGKEGGPRSVLSDLSDANFPKGWKGYFQMDPDGSFSTPYLPEAVGGLRNSADYAERLKKQEALEKATSAFRKEMKGAFANRSLPEKTVSAPPKSSASGSGPAKSAPNIYPNPIASKQVASQFSSPGAEKAKMAEPPLEMAPQLARRQESADEESVKNFAKSPAMPSAAPVEQEARKKDQKASASAGRDSTMLEESSEPKPVMQAPKPLNRESAVIWLDPFQAKVSDGALIFFRRVWVDQQMYLQGFVLETQNYFSGLMQSSFENSQLPSFAWVSWTSANDAIAQYGRVESQQLLFWKEMAYPLNNVRWEIHGEGWPKISTRFYLNILSGSLFVFATLGLFWIYRSSAAQVRLSQKRQDFVAAVSHELKTPLTSIRMYSEMLEDDWVGNEEKRKEYYKNIRRESERLSRLIENVLQMARLEKQSYQLSLVEQSPGEDVKEWGKQFKDLASREGFSFRLKAVDPLPVIRYEAEALKEVLLIFLENSIKFSRQSARKEIDLEIKLNGDRLEWIWKDSGPGVPERELSQIFGKFYRVENELTRKTKGTGIGLAIAKASIDALGAQVRAANRKEGGLEVKLSFPLVRGS